MLQHVETIEVSASIGALIVAAAAGLGADRAELLRRTFKRWTGKTPSEARAQA
jgi:hypothetical protein